jgi:hypothetical protein
MIKRFKDFILEKKLYLFDDFREVLSNMDSPLSKVVLDLDSSDYNWVYNFLNYSDELGYVYFTLDKKFNDVKIEVIQPNNYLWEWNIDRDEFKYLLDDTYTGFIVGYDFNFESGDILDLKDVIVLGDNFKVYAFTHNKFPNKIGVISSSSAKILNLGKNKVSVGKAIRDILKKSNKSFTDKELEDFVNEYKSKSEIKNNILDRFDIVDGEDIRHWYLTDNNENVSTSTLQNSCMNGEEANRYLDIYVENPGIIRLLILKNISGDKIIARALLWKLSDGRIFMDRIYYSNDYQVNLFINYARENNFLYKKVQSSSDDGILDSKGDEVGYLYVDLDRVYFDYYPYMDTMKYLDESKYKISNQKGFGMGVLESTEGERGACVNCNGMGRETCYNCDGDGTVECGECGNSGSVSCPECYGEGRFECGTCEGYGEIDDEEGEEGDKIECPDCSGSSYIKCEDCGGGGEVSCPECDGDTTISCYRCDGRGDIDCGSCN